MSEADVSGVVALLEQRAKNNGWGEWEELAQMCSLREPAPWGGQHTPDLALALEIAGREDGPSRRLLEALRAAGVRVNRHGGLPEPWHFLPPSAAPRGEKISRNWYYFGG